MDSSKVPPKFASFRPKPSSAPKPKERERSTAEQAQHHVHKNENGREDTQGTVSRSRDHNSRRRRSPRPGRDTDLRTRAEDGIQFRGPLSSQNNQNDYFIIDRKGDPSNVTYGSMDRYRIPPYRRYGNGCVLGIPTHRRIDKSLTTEGDTYISTEMLRPQPGRLLASKHGVKENARLLRFVKATSTDALSEINSDFIPIPTSRKRRRGIDNPSLFNERSVEFFSIHEKAEPEDGPEDSDTRYASEESSEFAGSGVDNSEAEVRQTNALLSRKTREHPHDLQAWLDLIDHQEAMVWLGRSNYSQFLSGSDQRNLSDIRISIYQQALAHFKPQKDVRIDLVLGMMAEASKSWDSKRLTVKWEEILNEYPRSIQIWMRYLDFKQTSFIEFKFETARANYGTCLRILAAAEKASDDSNDPLPQLQVYILVRMTSMIRESGYQELALAIWQAVLEYHLFRPDLQTGSRGKDEYLSLFQEFWESEVPRIGEVGAKGWNQSSSSNGSAPAAVVTNLTRGIQPKTLFEDFSDHETKHMDMLKYPGRTADEYGEDDPFHLILFSDIEEYLSLLPQNLSPILLVQAFLCFCHLPPLACMGTLVQHVWWQDPFLRDELLQIQKPEQHSHTITSFPECLTDFMACPMAQFQMTTELLFDRGFTKPPHSMDVAFLRYTLRQLASNVADDTIAEYFFAFEFKYFPTDALKSAKQFLKTRPSSLRLYNAYAIMEARNGNLVRSDHVFSTAIGMSRSLSSSSRQDSMLLWHSWVWEALRLGLHKKALRQLSSMATENLTSPGLSELESFDIAPALILKVRTFLSEGRDHALSTADYTSVVLYTSCLALLSYLSNNLDVEAALAVHQYTQVSFEKKKPSPSLAAELNAQSQARILALHATHARLFKPSILRYRLEDSLSKFPNNSILLSVYAANESRFRIEDRVRSIMYDEVLRNSRGRNSTIVGSYFGIYLEMRRNAAGSSTAHVIRATFERAEDSEGGKRSAALWTSHVLFELEQSRRTDDVQKVKQVFFRGLTQLPWSKEYMMLAFSQLRGAMTYEELKRVYNVMIEKELRIYVDLEETLENIERARKAERNSGHQEALYLPLEEDSSLDD